jgi:malonyl CoA-acyl carrier protein transacylase
MDAAVTPTLDVVRDTPVQSPRITVYSNCTGLPYDRREGKIRELMVRQINSPVKWEQIQQRIFAKRQVLAMTLNQAIDALITWSSPLGILR